ncbi:MAG: hemolysin family protein [Acidobacteriaceae bacterium]|jgi:CBS domain containing-hemolysin-like protein|nr:hemolysin family protein [Acidobacteriaceae bacterium]
MEDHSITGALWRIAWVLALVFANGFFVAAEFAIVTVRKTRIDQLIAEGHRGARAVRRAASDPDRYIAATQLGITMASIGLGWIGEPTLASMLRPIVAHLPITITEATISSIAIAIAFTLVTALHITLGELAPKTIALERAEKTALLVVKPTEIFMKVFWPFIQLLNSAGRTVVNLLGMRGSGGHSMVHSEEELKMLVTASQEAGVLEEHEEQMLHRVFGFSDLTAGTIMMPRTELVGIAAETSGDALLQHVAKAGHATTLLVYQTDLDNVTGVLHPIDIIQALAANRRDARAGELAHDVLTVPVTMGADDLLDAMRKRGTREAIVIDEYGGTAGLVTFEWLMERITGDLRGSGDRKISVHDDGSAEIDGLTLVCDVNEQFGLHIDEDTYTTLGGFVIGQIGRKARVGDMIAVEGRDMRVIGVDGLRVARIWVSRPEEAPTGE